MPEVKRIQRSRKIKRRERKLSPLLDLEKEPDNFLIIYNFLKLNVRVINMCFSKSWLSSRIENYNKLSKKSWKHQTMLVESLNVPKAQET
jgi:hypothetical protein